MGLRVKDGGGSECLPVTGRIGVETRNDAVRVVDGLDYPTRKRADFQTRSLITRKLGEPFSRGKANDGGHSPGWCAL